LPDEERGGGGSARSAFRVCSGGSSRSAASTFAVILFGAYFGFLFWVVSVEGRKEGKEDVRKYVIAWGVHM